MSDDLKQVQALVAAASPGPWAEKHYGANVYGLECNTAAPGFKYASVTSGCMTKQDIAFTTVAVNTWLELVKVLVSAGQCENCVCDGKQECLGCAIEAALDHVAREIGSDGA